MPLSELSAAAAEVESLQRSLTAAQEKLSRLSATNAIVMARRPVGVPATWLPHFTGSGTAATVVAWFDPNFFGQSIL